jgi:hypothetical protein
VPPRDGDQPEMLARRAVMTTRTEYAYSNLGENIKIHLKKKERKKEGGSRTLVTK